jgi:SEC-C motif-containing protein
VSAAAIDSGWAGWLPFELLDALAAAGGGAADRRALDRRLAQPADAEARERWERFRLVAPSRLDVPADPDELDAAAAFELLAALGLVAGRPPIPVAQPEAVELTLTLDEEDVRELERVRAARDASPSPSTPVGDLPSLDAAFGGRAVGRNEPCPCGSGLKYKRCHGR